MYYFYEDLSLSHHETIAKIFSSASQLTKILENLDGNESFLSRTPFIFRYAACITSVSFLRILKCSLIHLVDSIDVKKLMFQSMALYERLCSTDKEMASKFTLVFSQLMASTKAFKDSDGNDFTRLRIRTRLAMSPAYDANWWWREEFGGQRGAYSLATTSTCAQSRHSNTSVFVHRANLNTHQDDTNGHATLRPEVELSTDLLDTSLNENFISDFGWMDGDNALFTSGWVDGDYGLFANGASASLDFSEIM
jgi:hypothetical protein